MSNEPMIERAHTVALELLEQHAQSSVSSLLRLAYLRGRSDESKSSLELVHTIFDRKAVANG